MSANDTKTLHEKNEPRFGGLMSLMDIMGPTITCDECGRWQRLSALIEADARKRADENGWQQKNGKDICPICAVKRLGPRGVE